MALDRITPGDTARWRDDMAKQEGSFNQSIPVLALMLTYAEQLGYLRAFEECQGGDEVLLSRLMLFPLAWRLIQK